MLKHFYKVLACLILLLHYNLVAQPFLTPKELQDDLLEIKQSLLDFHPDLFAYQHKTAFEESFRNVENQLSRDMTENEFYRLVKPLVAGVKCGHTELYHSQEYLYEMNQIYFPLKVEINQNKEIQVTGNRNSQIPNGAIITHIDGLKSSNVIDNLLQYISSDGLHKNGRYHWLSKKFFLLYSDIIANNLSSEITYLLNDKTYTTQLLPKVGKLTQSEIQPIFKTKLLKEYGQNKAILKIESFDKSLLKQSGIKFKKSLNQFFETIKNENVTKLTIDLRNNSGGNDLLAIELYKYISQKSFKFYEQLTLYKKSKNKMSFPHNFFFRTKKTGSDNKLIYTGHKGSKWLTPTKNYYAGEVEVLINGGTMSAASHFAAKCHNNERAIIKGEVSAGNYKSSNSGFLVYKKLSHSGMQLFIPAIHYKLYLPNKQLVTEAFQPNDSVNTSIQVEN